MHLSLSLTFILLSRIFVGYMYYAKFYIVALLVSFLSLFSRLCAILLPFKINPNFFCQKWHAVGTMFCLLVIDIFFTCFGFALYSTASHGGFIYTSLFSPLNHSNHCFSIALTQALYSKIASALFSPSSALISTKERKRFSSGWLTSFIVSISLFRHFGAKTSLT